MEQVGRDRAEQEGADGAGKDREILALAEYDGAEPDKVDQH
jgi:hypothetical protein